MRQEIGGFRSSVPPTGSVVELAGDQLKRMKREEAQDKNRRQELDVAAENASAELDKRAKAGGLDFLMTKKGKKQEGAN